MYQFTCLIRLLSNETNRHHAYNLAIQPFPDEFNKGIAYWHIYPNFNNSINKITIRASDKRWPNKLVFKLFKSPSKDIDYWVIIFSIIEA